MVKCVCLYCGKSFETYPAYIRKGGGKYCSKECGHKANVGIPRSPEVIERIRSGNIGKKRCEETRIKVSAAAKKRFENPEERVRIQKAHLGMRASDETKKKQSHAHIKIHERDPTLKMRIVESLIGGFWYGNVRYWYTETPQYCEKFNREFKERVRAYWGYKCVLCGEPQNGAKLGIHHVHYDKKMCCNGSPRDVVPLCRKCHSKTNYNREDWEDYFTNFIYSKNESGKCFFTKEEMAALHHPAPDFRRDC